MLKDKRVKELAEKIALEQWGTSLWKLPATTQDHILRLAKERVEAKGGSL